MSSDSPCPSTVFPTLLRKEVWLGEKMWKAAKTEEVAAPLLSCGMLRSHEGAGDGLGSFTQSPWPPAGRGNLEP